MTGVPLTRIDWVETQLRQAILDGELAPGEQLNVATLSERFSVSPTPLREAMQRLAGEGLAELAAQRGARVAPLSVQDRVELTRLRSLLEPETAAQAAELGGPDWAAGASLSTGPTVVLPVEVMVRDIREQEHGDTGRDNQSGRRAIALVTGGNSGIGKEIARQLLGAGLAVYVGSRDAGRGQAAVEELGAGARPLTLDVADQDSVAAAAAAVPERDMLVNNAGISDAGQDPTQTDLMTLRRVYETKVFGVVAVTNAFLPALRRSAAPRIVNISSGTGSLTWSTGLNPQFDHRLAGAAAAYRSSKAALNALTIFYSQALDAHDAFKVNALAPSLRATNLNSRAAEHGGDPTEAAAAAVRLALLPQDGPTGGFFSWDGTVVHGEPAQAAVEPRARPRNGSPHGPPAAVA